MSKTGEKICATVAKLVDGNGIKAADVRLETFDSTVHTLPGVLDITLSTAQRRHTVPGPKPDVPCSIVESHAALDQAIRQKTEHILQPRDGRDDVLDNILNDQHHGWGLNGVFELDNITQNFCVTHPCQPCHNTGKKACSKCLGKTRVSCLKCRGQGRENCLRCHQSGTIINPTTNEKESCVHCKGKGFKTCTACQGKRDVACSYCQATGKENCPTCGGTGVMTDIVNLTFEAHTKFSISRPPTLSMDILRDFEKLGIDTLARDGHAQVRHLDNTESGKTNDDFQSGKRRLYLEATIPHGEAILSLNGQKLSFIVAGLKGTIVKSDRFLNTLLKPGILQLKKASDGHGNTRYLMSKACQFRAIRDVMMTCGTSGERKVARTLLKNYPFGLSKKYARAIAKFALGARKRVTRTARYAGSTIGVLINAGLFYSWFFTELRAQIIPPETTFYSQLGGDVTLCFAGILVGLYAVRLFAQKALKSALPRGATPRLPGAGTAGYITAALIFLGFLAAAYFAPDMPIWLKYITGLRDY